MAPCRCWNSSGAARLFMSAYTRCLSCGSQVCPAGQSVPASARQRSCQGSVCGLHGTRALCVVLECAERVVEIGAAYLPACLCRLWCLPQLITRREFHLQRTPAFGATVMPADVRQIMTVPIAKGSTTEFLSLKMLTAEGWNTALMRVFSPWVAKRSSFRPPCCKLSRPIPVFLGCRHCCLLSSWCGCCWR